MNSDSIDHQNTSAVFRIKPISGSSVCLKYKGIVTEVQKLGDEIVELDSIMHIEPEVVGKHAIQLESIDSYEMLGRIYRSNIVGSYVVLKSNYPVIYLTIEFNKSIVSGSLLQIYVSIEMDEEQKKSINSSKKYSKYNDLTFSGKWNISIECDPELREMYRSEILKIDPANIEWYDNIMSYQPFEFRTIKKTRDYLINLSKDDKFSKLLKIAMDCRVLNRRREHNIRDDAYEAPDPDKVVHLADVREIMKQNDELLEDSDSS